MFEETPKWDPQHEMAKPGFLVEGFVTKSSSYSLGCE